MDLIGTIISNFGFIAFTALSIALAAYLVYYMIRPQRF
ncbi:MAG: K(+)-transporting ATPase subunit F [Candidatus Thermoplasmatota archaeon]|jgi:K+-transporting ATPase KdpF subunit|nr:K(+)-transporting ATPase subunit F [Candidatus Thermoplasmatota archaeon]MCL5983316.1 K(+)-transporting ATPase subunit F [Candidatus Thermoplasmatota archaeon]